MNLTTLCHYQMINNSSLYFFQVEKHEFEADFSACNIHVHNLRNAQLLDIQVYRNVDLDKMSLRAVFNFPIVWLTGRYSLLG